MSVPIYRAFKKLDEKFLSKDDTVDIKDNVHVHTFAIFI